MEKANRIVLPMQYFAENIEHPNTSPTVPTEGNIGVGDPKPSTTEPVQSEKTFTQAEVDSLISKRLEREKIKFENDLNAKLSEAEKLAKMNAEQKEKYAREKREADLTKREQDIIKRELKATAKEILAEKKMPQSLADILDYSSSENCTASIETLQKAFSEAVSVGVANALKQPSPKKPPEGGTTADPFLEGLGI